MGVTPPKSKRPKYESKYQQSWEVEFPWIAKSQTTTTAHCKVCNRHFSVSHGGKNDVKKHAQTSLHTSNCKAQTTTTPVHSFFVNQTDDSVIRAECLFANFICEHNLSFNVADHFTKLCKIMFPDSKIALKFHCSRTKTSQIVKRSLAPSLHKEVIEHCTKFPYSLSCDESNDVNSEKSLAILVRYFTDRATTRFLAMPICNIGTGENIFGNIQQVFLDYGIPWENCISFMSDNCSVMTGRHNSVISRIKNVQPDVFDLGCVCHLANLCTVAAVKCLPLPVEDLLIDVYFHFHHSSKRMEQYKEFLDFTDTEPSKILKHCSTRWLSLQRAVERLLHHWRALRSYFTSHAEVEKPGRIKRVADLLNNHEMALYYHFLSFILPYLVEFNTMFQADESRIAYLGQEIRALLRKMLCKFVPSRVIRSHEDITTVTFKDTSDQLDDGYLAVGLTTRAYMAAQEDEIPPSVLSRFFSSVRDFYVAVVQKIISKFPFKDPVVNGLGFLIPSKRLDINPTTLVEICQRFPSIVSSDEVNLVEDEYRDFQCCGDSDIPAFVVGETSIDSFWGEMMQLKTSVTNTARFPLLCKIASAMCCIFNSNAECERVFSMVRKIQTDHRSLLDQTTTEALLKCKINRDEDCHAFKPSPSILKTAKSACVGYNKDLAFLKKGFSNSVVRD